MSRRFLGGFILLATALIQGCGASGGEQAATPSPGRDVAQSQAREKTGRFFSSSLRREMPYLVFLPPGYDSESRRYPVLYMLHGYTSDHTEWTRYGIFKTAERLILVEGISPFIIVLPEGNDSYWVDHAGGMPWGHYTAVDLVREIDGKYRTDARREARAIGGLSMGADGALQLTLNFPNVFGVAGAHSPAFRAYDVAPALFGDRAYWSDHAPVPILEKKRTVPAGLKLWVDIGDRDPWYANVVAFHELLNELSIPHEWRVSPGNHDGAYWSANVDSYLRFYGAALAP